MIGDNVGHGHVWERPDGVKARCGGPGLCSDCRADDMRLREARDYTTPEQVAALIKAKDYWHSEKQAAEATIRELKNALREIADLADVDADQRGVIAREALNQ